MQFVSITRLRIRSAIYMPLFFFHTARTLSQIRAAGGFVGGALLNDRQRVFWTMTLWQDQAAMRRFMASGAHLKAMPKLLNWCDEASVVHWDQDSDDLPGWAEADRRMRRDGRISKVRNPSPDHAGLRYREPRLSRTMPISRKG